MRVSRTLRAILSALSLTLVFCSSAGTQETGADKAAFDGYILVVSDRNSRVLAEIPLPTGRFDHVFTHSFHLTPVVERFRAVINSEGAPVMQLFELEYESPGVGMPSDAELGYRLVEGKFLLAMNREFPVISLMVSIVPGHGIAVNGKTFPFTDWVPQETMLFLRVQSRP